MCRGPTLLGCAPPCDDFALADPQSEWERHNEISSSPWPFAVTASFGSEPAEFGASHPPEARRFASHSKHCASEGCMRQPSFALEGQRAKFCSEHKAANMVDVKNPRCVSAGCMRRPHYGQRGGPARFCSAHKQLGMPDVSYRPCEEPGCLKHPTFGHRGQRARFCSAHRDEASGMVDLVNRQCEGEGCSKRPSYGYETDRRACRCAAHRLPGMRDVKNKRCEAPECSRQPYYGAPGVRVARFCSAHKESGMIDVKHKRCKKPGCPRSTYRHKSGEMYCLQHRRSQGQGQDAEAATEEDEGFDTITLSIAGGVADAGSPARLHVSAGPAHVVEQEEREGELQEAKESTPFCGQRRRGEDVGAASAAAATAVAAAAVAVAAAKSAAASAATVAAAAVQPAAASGPGEKEPQSGVNRGSIAGAVELVCSLRRTAASRDFGDKAVDSTYESNSAGKVYGSSYAGVYGDTWQESGQNWSGQYWSGSGSSNGGEFHVIRRGAGIAPESSGVAWALPFAGGGHSGPYSSPYYTPPPFLGPYCDFQLPSGAWDMASAVGPLPSLRSWAPAALGGGGGGELTTPSILGAKRGPPAAEASCWLQRHQQQQQQHREQPAQQPVPQLCYLQAQYQQQTQEQPAELLSWPPPLLPPAKQQRMMRTLDWSV